MSPRPPLKFLFIQPEFPRHYVTFFPVYEPLHGLLLAAIARDLAESKIFDRRFDSDKNLRRLLEDFKPDVIGSTTHVAGEVPNVQRLLALAKEVLPDCVTIVGGQHATLLPEDLFHPAVDLICIGPGEKTFREVMETVAARGDPCQVAGLGVRQGGTYLFTAPRIPRPGLFSWPAFDRSLLGRRYRRHYLNSFERRTTVYTITSSGCPHRCKFCSLWASARGVYRKRAPEEIVEDIAGQPQPFVHITDDNTFHSASHALEIYRLLKARGIEKKILAYARTDTIVERADVLAKWREVGLGALVVGMEACSDRHLASLDKRTTVDVNIQAQKVLDELGIENWAHFVIMPGFQRQDFEDVWSFVDRFNITYPVFVPLTPVPGTPLFFEAKTAGQLSVFDYGFYNLQYMVLKTALDKAEWYRWFHELYFRTCSPKTLWRRRRSPTFHLRPAVGRAVEMGRCIRKIRALTAEQIRLEGDHAGRYDEIEPTLPPSLRRDYRPDKYYNAPTLARMRTGEREREKETERRVAARC
jgi:radical SAM superfamily enzyme YgiQ (UPF0313 family)